MAIPIVFVIFQLNTKIDKKTRQSIINRIATEHTMPSAETVTFSFLIKVYRSQGRGSLKKKHNEMTLSNKVYLVDVELKKNEG